MRHFPRGKQYSALEKNLLKLRAFEMVLVLFRIQQLRGFVLESVRATRDLGGSLNSNPPRTLGRDAISAEEAWQVLVQDGVLTSEEVSKVRELIDYRNVIAHETERMTVDLNRDFQGRYSRLPDLHRYKPGVLEALDRIEAKIERGLRAKYVMSVSLAPVMFEPADWTYRQEIDRLRRKIGTQILKWNQEIEAVSANISSLPGAMLKTLQPGHPEHKTRSGTLSKSGVACCHGLFEAGATPLSTAYLMEISLRAAKKRFARWRREEGQECTRFGGDKKNE